MVLIHHCGRAGHSTSRGADLFNRISAAGWAGVDLFFVLSGFLITGLLLDARAGPGRLRRFWCRRALRILPLSYVFLTVVFFSPLWRKEPWHAGLYAEQGWFWLYINNWLAWHKPALDHGVLAHFWSLAIEEQFYLVWPIIALNLSWRRLEMVCLAVLGLSAIGHLAAIALHTSTDLVCSLTPSRMDGVVFGSWLAVRRRLVGLSRTPVHSHRRLWMLAAGLSVLLVVPARGLPAGDRWVMAVGFAALGAIFTLFLAGLLVAPKATLPRRVCEARPLVYLGRISYGFYVLHMPVLAWLRKLWPPPDGTLSDCLGFFAAALIASAALAAVSWFALERPLLRLRRA
jgi:peptidoglycan/LPS O-acetylase OafA/YrhL